MVMVMAGVAHLQTQARSSGSVGILGWSCREPTWRALDSSNDSYGAAHVSMAGPSERGLRKQEGSGAPVLGPAPSPVPRRALDEGPVAARR